MGTGGLLVYIWCVLRYLKEIGEGGGGGVGCRLSKVGRVADK